MVGWWKKEFQFIGDELNDYAWDAGKWVSQKPYSPYSYNLRQKFTGNISSWSVQEPAAEGGYETPEDKARFYVSRVAWVTWYSHGGRDAIHRDRKYSVKREVKVEWWQPEGSELDVQGLLSRACVTMVGVNLGTITGGWHMEEEPEIPTNYVAAGEGGQGKWDRDMTSDEMTMAFVTYRNRTSGDDNIKSPTSIPIYG